MDASPLPALKAAMDAYRGRSDAFLHTLHTFGGCTYELRSSRADAAPSLVSGSTAEGDACGLSGVLLSFYHAIPFADLNLYGNCVEELAAELRGVAPHCTCSEAPPLSNAINYAGVSLLIPADVNATEREAALAWAAALRVGSLLPLLRGILQWGLVTGERQTLRLLPHDSSPSFPDAAVSTTSLANAIFVCAIPLPSTSTHDASEEQIKKANSTSLSSSRFDGTVSVTTCITSDDDGEAVLLQRYLDAFVDAATAATGTVLVVHASHRPPPEIKLTPAWSAALSRTRHVWWCTLMAAPHAVQQPGVLEKLMERSLRLRPALFFHVHQEKQARHALLRQQLASYAALFLR